MHISKIFIQKNFVPDIQLDAFGRENFGCEITLQQGESVDEAIAEAQNQVAEYIKKNTVLREEMRGTVVKDISEYNNTNEIEKEAQEVKDKLATFEFHEDAATYLETTSFKHTIEFKKIVNNKPFKI